MEMLPTFDKIHEVHEVQVVPPYTVKTLSRMPEARQGHCTEIFDDSLLILGGKTTERYQDNDGNCAAGRQRRCYRRR